MPAVHLTYQTADGDRSSPWVFPDAEAAEQYRQLVDRRQPSRTRTWQVSECGRCLDCTRRRFAG